MIYHAALVAHLMRHLSAITLSAITAVAIELLANMGLWEQRLSATYLCNTEQFYRELRKLKGNENDNKKT